MSSKVTEWVLKFRENVNPQMTRVEKTFTSSYEKFRKTQLELDKNAQKVKQFGANVDQLNIKLDELTKRRNLAVDFGELKRLNREIDETTGKLKTMYNYGQNKPGAFSLVNLKGAINQSPLMGSVLPLMTNPYVLGGAALAAGGRFAYDAGMTRFNFNREFAKINATAQLDERSLAYLRKDVMEMGRNSATDIRTVPAAFEKILSATNNVALSKQILGASLRGSQAGFADVNEVASSTVGIMNAVGPGRTNANEVLDVLFASKRLGVGEFRDFANYLPSVVTQGTALGYNYKDVAGAFSYLTTKGYGADRTNMLLTNAFTALAKPEVLNDLKKYGIRTYDAQNNRLPLGDIFTQLEGRFAGKSQRERDLVMGDIIKDAQAREAFNALIKDVNGLNTMMGQTRNSFGELNKAIEKTGNEMNEVQKLSNNWESFKDNLGKAVAPALISVFEGLNNQFEKEQKFNEQKKYGEDLKYIDGYEKRRRKILTDFTSNKITENQAWHALYDYGGFNGFEADSYIDLGASIIQKSKALKNMAAAPFGFGWTPKSINPIGTFGNGTSTGTPPISSSGGALNSTMDNISGGGGVKNFTVSIQQMKAADKIEVRGTDAASLDKTENDFLELMMRVVQGVETAAGGVN